MNRPVWNLTGTMTEREGHQLDSLYMACELVKAAVGGGAGEKSGYSMPAILDDTYNKIEEIRKKIVKDML